VSAKNIYHDAVARALVADGWTITHDPYTVTYGKRDLFVDLGAERVIVAAERGTKRIAVEVQSFLSPSPVRNLQEAVGQYEIYRLLMAQSDPDRQLYMAVSRSVYDGVFSEQFGQLVVTGLQLRLLVFNEVTEGVVKWIE
jgi:hypothetical protein